MVESINSQGFGDGSEPDDLGVYRCSIEVNISHRRLPGDFIRRDAQGDVALVPWTVYADLRASWYDAPTDY